VKKNVQHCFPLRVRKFDCLRTQTSSMAEETKRSLSPCNPCPRQAKNATHMLVAAMANDHCS